MQTVPVQVTAAPAGTPQAGSTEKTVMPSLLSGGTPPARPTSGLNSGSSSTAVESTDKDIVYLDVDERTNRILMIGQADQLAIVEEVIDALDVEQNDLRSLKTYRVRHMTADKAKRKLEDLEVIGKTGQSGSGAAATSLFSSKTGSGSAEKGERAILAEIQVTVLESTNSLLINATAQQHIRIKTVLGQVDVAPEDLRTLKTYEIRYVDASEVKKKLEEFGFIGPKARPSTGLASVTTPASTPASPSGEGSNVADDSAILQEPQVSVLDATNSLLINATEFQHEQMARVIQRVDAQIKQEAIPYEIYFLENQDPDALAEVLARLIQETVKDREAKVEKVVRRLEDEILIVPDKGTFSLVVYANRKNQEWISKLIKTLDRRRPQVLIDVTLVEIRKTDQFNYDLNLIGGLPDMTQTGGQTGQFMADADTTVIDKLLTPGSRKRIIDFQANSGTGTGFYADLHVNALLTAVQTKNYGRVLAKPKVLVNDNEKGIIKTTDTTYVEKKSSIPVTSGSAGQQTNLIETAVDYQAYEAGITLEITPHISEGQLLRLEIALTRSDFGTITRQRPPDLTGSDVRTVVTVPDGSTIILGGMLKLNQTKGGSKVPILGDLPLVGGAFRGVARSDVQSKLYVFVRAEIIRPAEALAGALDDLERISERDRTSFEGHEQEFQTHEDWPGIKPGPTEPAKVLDAREYSVSLLISSTTRDRGGTP